MSAPIGDPEQNQTQPIGTRSRIPFLLTLLVICFAGFVIRLTDLESRSPVPLIRDPERASTVCRQADQLAQEKRLAEAYRQYARATRLNDCEPTGWAGRARMACQMGNYKQARRDTIFGLLGCSTLPSKAKVELWYLRARADFEDGQWQHAQASLRMCLQAEPNHGAGKALLARMSPTPGQSSDSRPAGPFSPPADSRYPDYR